MQKAGRLPGLFVLLCIIAWCAGCTGAVPGTPAPAETPATAVSPAPSFQDNTQVVTAAVTSAPALSNLSVFFIPVGQGDSILVITPEQKTMLIDAGPADAAPEVSGLLRRENVTALDIALATHAHVDHIGGMPEVLETFPVKEFV